MSAIENAVMFPIVLIIMAIMDYVAYKVLTALPGNPWPYLLALGFVNVATVFGAARAAAGGK
jgi:hypothetical protein